MATRVRYIVSDDLDGSTDDVVTHSFSLDGVDYVIDLTVHNFDGLSAAFAPYIAAGRRQPKTATRARRSPGRGATSRVRTWWASQQQRPDLPAYRSNGPLPGQVHEAYRTAH